jgi:DNA helicase-4
MPRDQRNVPSLQASAARPRRVRPRSRGGICPGHRWGSLGGRRGFVTSECRIPQLSARKVRLPHVALTRARHRVYLLYDPYDCSSFVRELKEGGYAVVTDEFRRREGAQDDQTVVPCPRCATGHLRVRDGEHSRFVSCDHFPVCNYRERGCGECGGLLARIGDYRVCADARCPGVHPACSSCGSPMQLRRGPNGSFFGCGNYGSSDFELQCSATAPSRTLPAASELRRRI